MEVGENTRGASQKSVFHTRFLVHWNLTSWVTWKHLSGILWARRAGVSLFPKALHHLGFGFPTSSIPKLPKGGRRSGRRGPDPNPKGSSSSVPIATGWCREEEEQGGNLGVSMTPNPQGWGCGASPQILQPPCSLGCGRAGFGKHP